MYLKLESVKNIYILLISLACVSSETNEPFIDALKGMVFQPFWSEIEYGLCTLVLNWVCFLEELATSSSSDDKTISHLMFTPTTVYVP